MTVTGKYFNAMYLMSFIAKSVGEINIPVTKCMQAISEKNKVGKLAE